MAEQVEPRCSETWRADAGRTLRWAVAALAAGVGVHGIDHMFIRGMSASPTSIIVGGNIQAAFVVVALIMAWTRRPRAPEAVIIAGFGSAVVFVYAHILPAVWHDYSDSFVSAPHTHVTWYSWVTAVAEIGAGIAAGVAGVRARRARIGTRPGGRSASAAPVEVESTIAAPPETLYELVSEVSLMGRWSPETTSCRWLAPATGPAVGAPFRGMNRRGRRRWSTTCTVVAADPGRRFGFEVRLRRRPVARWMYDFDVRGTGCRVVETWTDLRPAWVVALGWAVSGVADRAGHNRDTMRVTLTALARSAEQSVTRRP